MSPTEVDSAGRTRHRIRSGTVRLYTFKAGLLARAAHDLRLTVGSFEIESSGDRVVARIDPKSIEVDGAMRKGKLDETELNASHREQIQRTVQDEILLTREHPLVLYEGRFVTGASLVSVDGMLELRGRREATPFEIVAEGGRLRAQTEIEPSRWGISPYKALLGAIHLQDRVRIEIDLPDPRQPPS